MLASNQPLLTPSATSSMGSPAALPAAMGRVLLAQVRGELGPVVAAVRLGEEAKLAALVRGKGGVEGLQHRPHARGGRRRRVDVVDAVRKADANGLVDVQHVGVVVEAKGVVGRLGRPVVELARPVLLEQADGARAPGPAVEPRGQRRRGRTVARLEEPARVGGASE